MDFKPHFYLGHHGNTEPYTTPNRGGGGSNVDVPSRVRKTHAASLGKQLEKVKSQQEEIKN